MHWLSTSYVGYASADERPKMINQYFNVYALRRVRHAGYATGGDGGCRVGEVRAGTTSPMPDHKSFKLQ